MTAGTTVLGMLPLSLGLGEGSELQAPIAVVVMGGLTVSTLLTLVFLPALYLTVEEAVLRVRSRREAGAPPDPAPDLSTP